MLKQELEHLLAAPFSKEGFTSLMQEVLPGWHPAETPVHLNETERNFIVQATSLGIATGGDLGLDLDVLVVELSSRVVVVVVVVVVVAEGAATVVVVVLSVVVRAVEGGLVVVVSPWPAHPTMSSTTARSVRHTHIRFTTPPPDKDTSQGFPRPAQAEHSWFPAIHLPAWVLLPEKRSMGQAASKTAGRDRARGVGANRSASHHDLMVCPASGLAPEAAADSRVALDPGGLT